MSETDWFDRYMKLAEHIAQWSKDPSTKVGAVIVGTDRREIAVGFNGFPPGIVDSADRIANREVKYRLTQHAERAVMDNARFSLRGGTLVVTLHPCVECAKSAVAKGISCVYCPGLPSEDRWREENRPANFYSLEQARWGAEILREAGVDLIYASDRWRRKR